MQILKQSLIVSDHTADKHRQIVIKKNNPNGNGGFTKLGDVFDEMPGGIMYKEETGLGATTLELEAKRNSIVVEPIRITASSKAHKHNALYVGSSTSKGTSNAQIIEYLKSSKKPKKIVVVADSLFRLETVIGKEMYNDFFFMIDEIDSFQLDSSFRSSMDRCIDVYKMFPPEKRSMVTATLLKFSDPDLANEPITNIKYDIPTIRNIELCYSPKNILGSVIQKIKELIEKYPNDKIMVAFNSVKGAYNIAKYLTESNVVSEEGIKILCSKDRSQDIDKYFSELDEMQLPAKINLLTSAYFTGFDLLERYHLISVSSSLNKIHAISEKRLKQIAGRCRDKDGLLSETIIYNTLPLESVIESYSVEDLIKIAEKEIAALKCIKSHYENYPILKDNLLGIRKAIVDNTRTSTGQKLVRENNGESMISYLNIDAFIENLRVNNELYRSPELLENELIKQGHNLTSYRITSDIEVESTSMEKETRIKEVSILVEKIKLVENPKTLFNNNEKWTNLQKMILENYIKLFQYLEAEPFLDLIIEKSEGRDIRALKNLFISANFLTLDPSVFEKRIITFHIQQGKTYSPEQLLVQWNKILSELAVYKNLGTTIQAVRLTNVYFKTVKRKKTETPGIFIRNENAVKGLRRLSYRPVPIEKMEQVSSKKSLPIKFIRTESISGLFKEVDEINSEESFIKTEKISDLFTGGLFSSKKEKEISTDPLPNIIDNSEESLGFHKVIKLKGLFSKKPPNSDSDNPQADDQKDD